MDSPTDWLEQYTMTAAFMRAKLQGAAHMVGEGRFLL